LADAIDPINMYGRINQDKITLIISDELLDLVDNEKNGDLIAETVKLRQKLADSLGYVIPSIKFTNSETLEANQYRIDIRGIKTISGNVYINHSMFYAGQANITRKPKDAIEDFEPISGKRVFWINDEKTKNFWEKGLTPAQVIIRSLEYVVCRYVEEILDYKDVAHYISLVGTQNLFLVENLVPESLTIGDIRFILAGLIREKVSIKDIVHIFEKLNDLVQLSSEKDILLEKLRIALGRQICSKIADSSNNIYGIVLDDSFSEEFSNILVEENDRFVLPTKDSRVNKLIKRVLEIIKNTEYDLNHIVIVSPPEIRAEIYTLFEMIIPELSVISPAELTSDFNLEIIEKIKKTFLIFNINLLKTKK